MESLRHCMEAMSTRDNESITQALLGNHPMTHTLSAAVCVLLLTSNCPPEQPADSAEQECATAIRELEEEWVAFCKQCESRAKDQVTRDQRVAFRRGVFEQRTRFANRFLGIANQFPDADNVVEALIRAFTSFADLPAAEEAAERLGTRHHRSPQVRELLIRVAPTGKSPFESTNRFLRTAGTHSDHKPTQALATFRLAQVLHYQAELARQVRASQLLRETIAENWEGRTVERLRTCRPEVLDAESDDLLDTVAEKFSDLPGTPNYARLVVRQRQEVESLSIGCRAPEIAGEDLQGRPMRLSDFHGSVVAIAFWGSWCGPCMQMIPHERELVERHREDSFVLVGVNADQRESALAVVERENISWKSFWDGDDSRGPIATAWNVTGWPSTYVLDAAGHIRFKDLRGEALGHAIEHLISESRE